MSCLPEAAPETSTDGAIDGTANIGADGLFQCLDEAGLEALPLPECLVEGLVLERRPTIFYGLFGTGKSIIALDMALSVSQKPTKSPDALSEKEQAIWQALLTFNANGAAGVTSGEWAAKAKELDVSGATFERAKKKLQQLGKVECDNPGKFRARFTPRI